MEELIGLDVRLDADGKETWELFREINSEREKARLRFFNNKDSLLLIQASKLNQLVQPSTGGVTGDSKDRPSLGLDLVVQFIVTQKS